MIAAVITTESLFNGMITGFSMILKTSWPYLLVILFILVLLAFLKGNPNKKYRYQKRSYFLTKNELAFYLNLTAAIRGLDLVIFSKVRLADLVEPKKGNANWQGAFNKIKSKHVDFILCEPSQITPMLIIELDDKSHERQDRKERDAFVDQALDQANLPILHVKDQANLREKIVNALPKKAKT